MPSQHPTAGLHIAHATLQGESRSANFIHCSFPRWAVQGAMLLLYATALCSSFLPFSPNELLLNLLVWWRICYGHIPQRSLQHRCPQGVLSAQTLRLTALASCSTGGCVSRLCPLPHVKADSRCIEADPRCFCADLGTSARTP